MGLLCIYIATPHDDKYSEYNAVTLLLEELLVCTHKINLQPTSYRVSLA